LKRPEASRKKSFFDNLTPLYPDEHLRWKPAEHFRLASLICDAHRQRSARAIVRAARTGKTMLLQTIAIRLRKSPEVRLSFAD
jgi:transcription termination factor Rho